MTKKKDPKDLLPRGGPTKYKPKYCEDVIKYYDVPHYITESRQVYDKKSGSIITFDEKLPNILPTVDGFASSIGVHKDTLYEWAKVHPKFSDSFTRAKQFAAVMYYHLSLVGDYSPQFAKFYGINCMGLYEKIITENTNINTDVEIDLDDGEDSESED